MPAGHGEERKLTQVLLNLVGNAIKFPDTGEVTIKVASATGRGRAYFAMIRLDCVFAACTPGLMANVNHIFQPSGRFSAPNSL